jgi:hypothetical protein
MSLIENWELENNFWDINKKFKGVGLFKDVYDADKSKKKKASSKTMWAVALFTDYESLLANMLIGERRELVEKDHHDGEMLPDLIIDEYNFYQRNSERRYLSTWNSKVDEMERVLKETHVTLENMDDITKHLLQLEKLLSQKDAVIKRISKKQMESKNQGGAQSSLLEQDSFKA